MNKSWLTDFNFAHRGLHGPRTGHVENSLSAFHAANEAGYGFELDVLLSQDNKAMVIHDVDLKRLTGQNGRMNDYSAEQISHLKLSHSGDTIPSLAEVLQKTDSRYPVLIEIKGDQNKPDIVARAVYDDIQHYNGPVAIMSFYPEIIEWYQQNAPHILRGLVATSLNDGDLPEDYFSPPLQISYIDKLDVGFIAYDIKALPNDVTTYCRNKGIPVLTWTVRTPAQRENARLNTDNIIFEYIT